MNGCILLSRKIIDSEIWHKPPLYIKVWVYLLVKAQYRPYKGLERGELYTSIKEIQEACGYYSGYRYERPSKDQIWRILEWLRCASGYDDGCDSSATTGATMIATTKATHGIRVSVVNYCKYQDMDYYGNNGETDNGRDDGNGTGQTRARRHRDNINEEDKERYKSSSSEDEKQRLFQIYLDNHGGTYATPQAAHAISDWVDILGAEIVEQAICRTAKDYGQKPFKYIEKVLKDWDGKGLHSVKDIEGYVSRREERNKQQPYEEEAWAKRF